MGKAIKSTVRRFAHRRNHGMSGDLADVFKAMARGLFDDYRPEMHYMRGPGPKWHAKHDRPAADFVALPALARVRVKG